MNMVRLLMYSPYSFIAKGSFWILDNTHNESSLEGKCKYNDIRSMETENSSYYKICC